MSSAYLTDWWIFSIPLRAILANRGLTTAPCGVRKFGIFWVDSCFQTSEDSSLDALWGYESFHYGCVRDPIETLFDIEFDNSFIYSV